ncbi:hypothetical protein O3M35_002468 [Rhynocoris fuscipes]|uniref:Origin recognition complex subunit 3 n=1 Tax=Rhynocoris fuscipes TaxID=488301 RepID=A0AAW1CRF8_9HEMI
MQGPESVSKGCFGFRPKSPPGKKRNKQIAPNPLKIFSNEIWNIQYTNIWSEIENKLESTGDNVTEALLNELLEFIDSSEISDQIPTAALLTGINLPDHGTLFEQLIRKIKNVKNVSHSVALLSSSECYSIKLAIEKTVSHLISGITTETEFDESDEDSDENENVRREKTIKKSHCTMPSLLQWYQTDDIISPSKRVKLNRSKKGKLIIIIKDFEAVSSKVLQDFIHILGGYVNRLPFILVLGIATTLSSIADNLSHSCISRLALKPFQAQPSVYFLNNTLNKVFLTPDCPFQLSGKLFKFFTNVFLFYDFSVNRFTQGIKYCVMEHFREGGASVSLLCCFEKDLEKNISKMDRTHLDAIRRINSFKAYLEKIKDEKVVDLLLNDDEFTKKEILKLMKQLRLTIKEFYLSLQILHLFVSQLPSAPLGVQLRELYTLAMTNDITKTDDYKECRQLLEFQAKDQLLLKIDLILKILKENEPLLKEFYDKLLNWKSKLENAGLNQVKRTPVKLEIRKRSQLKQKVMEMGCTSQTEFEQVRKNVLDFIMFESLGNSLQPVSVATKWCLWEVVILVESDVRYRVVPRIRAPIHVALNNPFHYLQCNCCKITTNEQIPATMPDICIVYKLHLENRFLINMYDWLQSFNVIVDPDNANDGKISQEIQARFTQAVAELEFLGFVKSSKKKTDHMERLTCGGAVNCF